MESDVTVLGAGRMGSAVVTRLRQVGRTVTVWNRRAERALPLVEQQGAHAASDVEAALAASPLSLVCLTGYEAATTVLVPALAKTPPTVLLPLVTCTPGEAEELAMMATEHGHRCLGGAIFGSPASVEAGAAFLLLAGPAGLVEEARPTATSLGSVTVVGERPGDASVVDAAVLSTWYALASSFLHSMSLCATGGVDGAVLAPILSRVAVPTMAWLAREWQQPSDAVVQCSTTTHAAALATVVRTARSAGLPVDHLEGLDRYFEECLERGHGDADLPALRHVFSPAPTG